jgi:hypothetical protein
MDYGQLIRRAWDIVWNNKWLLVLGLLVTLGTSGTSRGNNYNYSANNFGEDGQTQEFDFDDLQDLDQEELEDFINSALPIAGLGMAILIPICCILLLIGLALWVAGTIAQGALIAGVDQIEREGQSKLADAWRPAWAKGWRLVGISLVAAIPGVVFFLVAIGIGIATFGTVTNVAEEAMGPAIGGLIALGLVLCCVVAVVSIAIKALVTFATRACMLEDTSVFGSYGRGWEVLRGSLGQAIVILLIQVGISIVIGLATLLPGLCCLLWPLLLLVDVAKQTYFSTLWTLGWHQWSGSGPTPKIVEQVPAV